MRWIEAGCQGLVTLLFSAKTPFFLPRVFFHDLFPPLLLLIRCLLLMLMKSLRPWMIEVTRRKIGNVVKLLYLVVRPEPIQTLTHLIKSSSLANLQACFRDRRSKIDVRDCEKKSMDSKRHPDSFSRLYLDNSFKNRNYISRGGDKIAQFWIN